MHVVDEDMSKCTRVGYGEENVLVKHVSRFSLGSIKRYCYPKQPMNLCYAAVERQCLEMGKTIDPVEVVEIPGQKRLPRWAWHCT